MTRPTQPITPATATVAAVSSETVTINNMRSRSGRMPKERASSSPRESRLTRQRSAKTTSRQGRIGRTAVAACDQVVDAKEPISQKVIDGRVVYGSARYVTSETSALNSAEITMPPSTMVRIGDPVRNRPRVSTSSAAVRPATNAPETSHTPPAPSRMVSTPPKEAAEDTPMTSGETSGLRNKLCNTAPETASAAPTMTASTTRGARISQTALASAAVASAAKLVSRPTSSASWSTMIAAAVSKGTARRPTPNAATAVRARTSAKAATIRVLRRARERSARRAGVTVGAGAAGIADAGAGVEVEGAEEEECVMLMGAPYSETSS